MSSSRESENKPHIEYPDWGLHSDYEDEENEDRGQDSIIRHLNHALDEAVKVVNVAMMTREKLGDDTKWATALLERLTPKFDSVTEQLTNSGKTALKNKATSAIVAYLAATRKLLFEAA